MKLRALKASVFLSLLFLVVYHACNWVTAQRADVGTIYFAWERWIPFVPLFILPYLSIDLFYIAAPFLCDDENELRVLVRRIALAILVAGACFLFFPLQLAVPRPEAGGPLGAAFRAFCAIDRPHNLLPSLHLAFCVILAGHYARHSAGPWRFASNFWFLLIALSALFTYQHHFIDVVGGLILGALCIYLFPEKPNAGRAIPNRRLAGYYGAGSLICLAAAVGIRGWGWLLLWPALAQGIVAAGYLGLGPGIFRKENGILAWPARWLLAPVLLGQRLSHWHYCGQCRAWDEAAPGVLIGRQLNDAEAAGAVKAGVTAVLDLTGEFSEALPFREVAYRNLPILDLTAPTAEQMRAGVSFIEAERAHGTVYVHCKIGYSRSAAVVGAWLVSTGVCANADEAMARLRAVRPTIVIRPEAERALRELVATLPSSAAR